MPDNPAPSLDRGLRPEDLSPALVPAIAAPIVAAAKDGGDLVAAIGASTRKLGFEHFAYARFRRNGDVHQLDGKRWGSHLPAWDQAYRERRYWRIDPRFRAALRSAIPEVWERARYPETPKLNEFFDAAASFGVGSGVCMVINQPNPSLVEYFSVCSPTTSLDSERRHVIAGAMGDLWSIGVYGHRFLPANALAETSRRKGARVLTGRELECLTLAARGATSRQIAEKLGISERTVNAHIERAIRKCGARNRQEAVAKNISNGAITV